MFSRSMMALFTVCVLGYAGQVEAGVKGKFYNVSVSTNFGDPFDDVWEFGNDNSFSIGGGSLQGEFTQSIDLGFLSFFSAAADDGQGFSTEFSGIQFLPFIFSNGSGSGGESYSVFGSQVRTPNSSAPSGSYSK